MSGSFVELGAVVNEAGAAHPVATTLLGDRVLVREVRVNDRGPTVTGRIIDLSNATAKRLGAIAAGTIPVSVRVLSTPP